MKINTTLKSAIIAASALAMTAIAAPASAGVVTFQTSGTWSNVVGGSYVTNTTGNGSNAGDATLSWGSRNGDKSAFQFDAKNAGSFNLNNGGSTSFFTLADFKHVNEQISGSGITSAKLNFATKIFVDNVLVTTRDYVWNFNLDETADYSWSWLCGSYGGANGGCNDKVTVAGSGNFGDTFQVGNDLYTLNLSGFQMKNGNNYVDTSSFITAEDTTNAGYIRGKLSMTTLTSAVPEPSTWAMMLIGFFGAGTALRSTRRKALTLTVA